MNYSKKKEKGDLGEEKVKEILQKHLKENFYIKRGFQLPYGTDSLEIDLLLYHPAYGMFILEVKNISNPEYISKNHFEQAKKYKNIILSLLNEKLKKKIKLSINFKVIYPSISKKDAKIPFGYENHVLFKEDLNNLNKLFFTTNNYIPSQEELDAITEILQINTENLPIISQDGIKYFDQKQLSALNSYRGGFRLIRGVAGSGKSILLTKFANSKKEKKILIIAFNTKLLEKLKNEINNPHAQFFTLFKFLISLGIKLPEDFKEKFKFIKENTHLIYTKIKKFQENEKFDYLLIDEAQDIEAGTLRSFIESFENSLIFIDEAQKFNEYSIDNFYEVSKHPYFKSHLSISGRRTISLKNIYRSPRNIAKCAIEIVRNDKTISSYYKRIKFINNDFEDINFILKDGKITTYSDITKIINSIPKNESYLILTRKNEDKKHLEKKFQNVHTISSIKGLEADHIIVDKFDDFLKIAHKNDIFYRQLYVILTRAKKNIYLNINSQLKEEKIKKVLNIIEKYKTITSTKPKEAMIKDIPTLLANIRFWFF